MTYADLFDRWMLHVTLASAFVIGASCVAEVLAPSSVLAHVPFFWFIIPLLAGSVLLRPRRPDHFHFSILSVFPVAVILLGYLWMRIHTGGISSLLLFESVLLLSVTAFAMFFLSSETEDLEE